jgi:hypothetical protein
MGYSVSIMLLMLFFSFYHMHMATQDITTNERLRGVYRRKPNPFRLDATSNWSKFVDLYPSTPSSIFNMHKSLVEDEENFYHTILKRYGKLV